MKINRCNYKKGLHNAYLLKSLEFFLGMSIITRIPATTKETKYEGSVSKSSQQPDHNGWRDKVRFWSTAAFSIVCISLIIICLVIFIRLAILEGQCWIECADLFSLVMFEFLIYKWGTHVSALFVVGYNSPTRFCALFVSEFILLRAGRKWSRCMVKSVNIPCVWTDQS